MTMCHLHHFAPHSSNRSLYFWMIWIDVNRCEYMTDVKVTQLTASTASTASTIMSHRRSPPAPSTSSRRRSYSAPTSYQPRRRTMTVSPRRGAARRRAPSPPAPAPVNTRRRTSSINGQTSLWFQVLGVGRWNGNWMILLYYYCYIFIAVNIIVLYFLWSMICPVGWGICGNVCIDYPLRMQRKHDMLTYTKIDCFATPQIFHYNYA